MRDLLALLKEYKPYLWRISAGMLGLMLFILAMNYGEQLFSPPPLVINIPRARQLQAIDRWLHCRCLTVQEALNDTLTEEYFLGYDAQGRLRAHNRHIFFDYDSLDRLSAIYIYHDDEGYGGRRVQLSYLSSLPQTPFTLVKGTVFKRKKEQVDTTSYFAMSAFPPGKIAWYELLPPEENITELPQKQKEGVWRMKKGEKHVYLVFDEHNRLTEEIELDPYLPTTYALSRRRFSYDAGGFPLEKIQVDSIISPGRNVFKLAGKQLFRYAYAEVARPLLFEKLVWNGVEWKLKVRRECTYRPVEINTRITE